MAARSKVPLASAGKDQREMKRLQKNVDFMFLKSMGASVGDSFEVLQQSDYFSGPDPTEVLQRDRPGNMGFQLH